MLDPYLVEWFNIKEIKLALSTRSRLSAGIDWPHSLYNKIEKANQIELFAAHILKHSNLDADPKLNVMNPLTPTP